MNSIFISLKDLKVNRTFKLPAFDCEGRSIPSNGTYKVIGKLLTKFKCIDIYTGEYIYLPCNTYVKIFVK